MTGRARSILDNVRFVKAVLRVTAFAFAIDLSHGDAVAEAIAQHLAKFPGGHITVVTLGAVIGEIRVTRRDLASIEKSFAAATGKKENRKQAAEDRQ